MNAIIWTQQQLERLAVIRSLYESADPGTFTDLELLTLDELQTLEEIVTAKDLS